jgi:hypothetical protein
MIAGVEKGGTTWLGHLLANHPQVLYGPSSARPEIEFDAFLNGTSDDPLRFRHAFVTAFGRPPRTGEVVVGKSVDIFHRPAVALAVHRHNPACRLIVSLRNPLDRAYSSYWYQRYRGEETAPTFEEALRREREARATGVETSHRSYLGKGLYVEHLERLHEIFGREQIVVVLLDELRRDREAALDRVLQFLDLGPTKLPDAPVKNAAKMNRWPWLARAVHRGGGAKHMVRRVLPTRVRTRVRFWLRQVNTIEQAPPPMNAATRAELRDFFRPHNERLAAYLGRDLDAWLS